MCLARKPVFFTEITSADGFECFLAGNIGELSEPEKVKVMNRACVDFNYIIGAVLIVYKLTFFKPCNCIIAFS